MDDSGEVVVVRLGHRVGRDDRMTTHVGLTARAIGADRFVLVGGETGPIERIEDVTARFGGPFQTQQVSSFQTFVDRWSGRIAHLTMYGLPLPGVLPELQSSLENSDDGLAIVVGAEKVEFDVYELADWNVAVTNEPHSEVGSLAITLDRLFEQPDLQPSFTGGTHRIIPNTCGKTVSPVEDLE